MGEIADRNFSLTKAELEHALALEAQASMARAREEDLLMNAKVGEDLPAIVTDTAWDHGRNGSHATTAFIGLKTGKIVHEETTRRSDPNIKSSTVRAHA